MAKKFFTDESLETFVDEIKAYTDDAVSTKADSSHNHAASNITSGTLSSDRLPTVPIAKGGTGATTAAAALTNLGLTATATELNYMDGVTSSVQTQLNGKAASSHGTHVTFDSTNKPKMDGTAAFGTSSNVARADHVHPTDTSRASKTEFDTHVADTTAHMTSTQKSQLTTAYNHSQAAHAPSNAEANQNAFSNVTVGSTTIAADTTTDTLTLVAGSNVTLTPDATNDKITIAATDTVYTHPTTTARTGVPTANQTPAFGGTFSVNQVSNDTSGHVSAITSRTVTIPSTLSNGTSTAGLIKTSSTVTSNSSCIH